MDNRQISDLIDRKIRAHEIRVGIVSGILGVLWLVAQMFVTVYFWVALLQYR